MNTKRCTKCGEIKSIIKFCNDKSRKDGLKDICKICANNYNRKYQQNNREKRKKYQNKWYQQNKNRSSLKNEKKRNREKEQYKNLRQDVINGYGAVCKLCNENNIEFLAIDHINNDGAYDRKNGLVGSALYRRLRKLNFPKDRYQLLCHNCNHLKELQRIHKDNNLKRRSKKYKIRIQVVEAYGGKCTCCGNDNPDLMCIDHIYNDGAEERKKIGRGSVFYIYLRKNNFPKDKYRLMCFNCNQSRGSYGYCPHKN
jgi:hypothetical protein